MKDNITVVGGAAVVGVAAGACLHYLASTRKQDRCAKGQSSEPKADEVAPQAPRRKASASKEGRTLVKFEDQRAHSPGIVSRWTRPVVITSPGLEDLAQSLSKRLGCEEFPESAGPTLSLDRFKSNDPNLRFNWQRVVGRKIVFLFDTVDQSRLFEQLSLLQALQGFAVPDAEDLGTKWKTYQTRGTYAWGRASHITVVLPWYRPCQMERTSRWHLQDGKWSNGHPEGQWLDVPTAQYFARLLSTPGSVPPLPGPSSALDGMSLDPLWRPPLELLFVELHEEAPIKHSVSDLGATVRMERFVPYFLDKFRAKQHYPGKTHMYVLFPDKGAYSRYCHSVVQSLKLDADHILYITKTRVAESIQQEQKLFFEAGEGAEPGEKDSFCPEDHVLIIDDFTNSGGTLFGAVNLVTTMLVGGESLPVSIFVTHLVAAYDPKVVQSLLKKLHDLGPQCRFNTTNTIPSTTNLLREDPQVTVFDVSDFVADLIQ